MTFPTPVGGTPLPVDFAPSVLFAVLYGILAPFAIFRFLQRRTRTTLLIGTLAFAIERIVIFSLRAAQARNGTLRMSKGLASYLQISFGLGFVGIANDLVKLIRCLLVNSTYGSDTYDQSPAAATKECYIPKPPQGTPDNPRQRFWARRFSDFFSLAFLSATVPGIVANSTYGNLIFNDHQRDADATAKLRYVSCGVALFLLIVVACAAAWSRLKQPRTSKRACWTIALLSTLTGTIAVYRLSVMYHTTTSWTSTGPGTLNSSGAKAAFYIFHVLPEWLASVALFSTSVRKAFGTGLAGDWRFRDETPAERQTRLEKEAKKAEKKKETMGSYEMTIEPKV